MPGNRFTPVIDERKPDTIKAPADIDRVLMCSGKVYYELLSFDTN